MSCGEKMRGTNMPTCINLLSRSVPWARGKNGEWVEREGERERDWNGSLSF